MREWIDRDVIPATEGRLRFHARVASNVLGMVEREIELGPEQEAGHRARLARLGVTDDAELADAIRRSCVRRPGRGAAGTARRVGRWTSSPSPTPATSPSLLVSDTRSDAAAEDDGLAGGELAAGGVDVGAAVPADGCVRAERLEQVAELLDTRDGVDPVVG